MLDLEKEVRRVFDRQTSSLSIPDGFDALVRSRIAAHRRRVRIAIAAAAVLVIAAAGAVAPRVVDGRDDDARLVTDGGPNASGVPDVVGLDYRDAQQRLEPLAARVLLSLDPGTGQPVGNVTRTVPGAGQPVAPGADLVVYVAWNRPASTPGTTAPGPTLPGTTGGNDGSPVGSNVWFPPLGLIAGLSSATPDPRCQRADPSSITVRFLNGEVVGCMIGGFVWLDALDEAALPIGTMPDVRGLGVDEASMRIRQVVVNPSLSYTATGTSEHPKVVATTPAPGEPISKLTRVMVILDGIPLDLGVLSSPATTRTAPTTTRASSQISGKIANGQPFVVREDPSHGLCVTLGTVDLGCDDVGPVVSPGADASTPRRAVHFFSGNTDGFWLYYAYLHPKAVAVYLVLPDGTRWNVGAVSEPRYWAIPIPSPYTADEVERLRVVYVDATGAEFDAPKRS